VHRQLEFNLRWNLTMMWSRTVSCLLGGHYNEYLVDLVQRAAADWEPSCPVPPQCPAAIDQVGTGEEWARPGSVGQHRSWRIITRSTGGGDEGGLGWRDVACCYGRRNLLEGLPCRGGTGDRVWDGGNG
ncbi:unnamed protein product, partial [Ectocarpus sp. 8 AP-2014]